MPIQTSIPADGQTMAIKCEIIFVYLFVCYIAPGEKEEQALNSFHHNLLKMVGFRFN
jgi:hypothetical protein